MELAETQAEGQLETISDSHHLLYPELLSHDSLVEILRQRFIRRTDLKQLQKDQLLDLYYEYIIPLPQRTYRKNRRGKEMSKRQITMAKKRKTTAKDVESPKKKKMENTGSESRLLTSFKLPHSDSKEATLPSCINFEKKKIKLTPSSVSSCSELSSSKPGGKITLKRCVGISSTCLQETDTEKKCTIAPPEKKIIKLVSNPTSSNKQRDTSVRNTEESTLMDETTKQDFMNASRDISAKTNFKAKKIAWP
uniref:Ashwin n=1 Tax=Crassostrea virginica TaxID=6565 RepID=A0A8B8ATC8_CRAVI|nr:ashwin-like isoform X1 [Crassostrea virginica]XP_022293474.1 ashwin-like isoform X1 [Crassostrea virginica]XP_022293475.1 ashwin-like isoform X1 [Crassostrea virginica]